MSIRYYKLFDLLNRKGMKKSDLRKILSSATVAKLSKGEYISGEAIDKICNFLNCQPGDIMEHIKETTDGQETLLHAHIIYKDNIETEIETRPVGNNNGIPIDEEDAEYLKEMQKTSAKNI